METSYLAGTSHASRDEAVSKSKSTNVGKRFLLAIAIIILIGSIVATGCLYEKIGNWSLGIGGGGLIVTLVLTAIGLCYNCKTSSQPHIEEKRHSNISQTSPADSEETAEKKSLNHQSIKQPQIPVRAGDIKLPETLPKNIPTEWDITGTIWLDNSQLHLYTAYLTTQFSQIGIQAAADLFTIDFLARDISNYLFPNIDGYGEVNLPIHLLVSDNHWTLVYIDRQLRTVEYYDSKKNYGNHHVIVRELTKITKDLSEKEPHKPPYKFIRKINKTLQPDSYQCGIWSLYFLENRLINPAFDFNQLNIEAAQSMIAEFRIKVQKTIITLIDIETAAYKKAKLEYIKLYKDQDIANKQFLEDVCKISYIEKWKQIITGKFLTLSH